MQPSSRLCVPHCKGCTIFQLYFEAGQIPARIAIKRMKIVFFRYILTQKEDSLLFKFLMAQKKMNQEKETGIQK